MAGAYAIAKRVAPTEVDRLAKAPIQVDADYRVGTCHLRADQTFADFAPECFATRDHRTHILLWGDSAATALSFGLRAEAGTTFSVSDMTSSLCPPLLGVFELREARPNCQSVNTAIAAHIAKTKPDVVVMSALDFQIKKPDLLQNSLAFLKRSGVPRILVVGPPPVWPDQTRRILPRDFAATGVISRRLSIGKEENLRQRQVSATIKGLVEQSGATYLSPFDPLCQEDLCLLVVGDELSTWDTFHLRRGASKLMADAIYATLRR
jgi:hypothetical protein